MWRFNTVPNWPSLPIEIQCGIQEKLFGGLSRTGGCGFIGSHLVDALHADGYAVRILDDLSTGKCENVPAVDNIVVGDVSDADVVKQAMAGMDGCFHLAAIASVQRSNEE